MQRGGWERQSSAIRVKCEEIKAQGTLFLVRCGIAAGPATSPSSTCSRRSDIPHTGTPDAVHRPRQEHRAPRPVTGLTVTLKVDGQPLDKDAQPIEKLGPGETKPVTLTGKIDQAGWRVLTAEVKSDQLDDDNKFDRVILVREKVRVLVVDGSPNERDPEKAGSYFLAHALLPVPEEFKYQYHVQPTVVKAADAAPGLLADKDVCILVNAPLGGPGSVPEDFVQRLGEFVKDGHGLLITGGPNVQKDDVQPAARQGRVEAVADGTRRRVRGAEGQAAVPGPEHDRREVVPGPVQAVGERPVPATPRRLRAARRTAWSSRRTT